MNNTVCFYHRADMDGKCSGAIVKYLFSNTKLIPFDYGYDIDWSLINKDTLVIMTDISVPKEDMIRLKKESGQFIWIDHHISKINELKDIKFDGLQVDGIAACVLTWNFFMNDNTQPIAVRLLGDYDVWNLTPSVLHMQYGIRQYDCEPENRIFWKDVFENNLTKEIITKGETIYKYVTKTYKHEINSIGFITELCVELNEKLHTYNVLAVNRSHISSLFFEDHPEVNNVDIMIPFSWNGKSWKVSMYTMKDDIDVSKICYKFGGGGHKKAAGFTCDNLPVEISKALFK